MMSEMKGRYLTLNFLVRRWQIEKTRFDHSGEDETKYCTRENIKWISDIVRENFPHGNITWALSWEALMNPNSYWRCIREIILQLCEKYRDDITFNPAGGFPNIYNTKQQVNEDIDEAFEVIKKLTDKYPKSIVSWQLSAENLSYIREKYGAKVASAHCWSQEAVDNLSSEGSIMYPYYPSRRHYLKPAKSREDMIDILMLDVISLDLVTARLRMDEAGQDCRMGVQPIETVLRFGYQKGFEIMKQVTDRYFQDNWENLPFVWVTNQLEMSVIHRNNEVRRAFKNWLDHIRKIYKDVHLLKIADFSELFRKHYQDNSKIQYSFRYRGIGISSSDPEKEVLWWMNKDYRLGVLVSKNTAQIMDYLVYTDDIQEPQGPESNWNISGIVSQKKSLRE